MSAADSDLTKYRNALLWAVDYFNVGGMTDKERMTGIKELGKVLLGHSTWAANYVPNDWDDSANLGTVNAEDKS